MYMPPTLEVIHGNDRMLRRQDQTPADQQQTQTWTYIVAAVVGVIFLLVVLLIIYSNLRKLRAAGASPKYIPTKFLKRRWEAWRPQNKYQTLSRDEVRRTHSDSGAVALTPQDPPSETTGVNRNTSVRSIMTLPAYSQKPKETEEVIGREGERAGIDTVLELPETLDEEEERRETEMESLYQIRQARRREIAEREERRRERREARERNDYGRLEELRRESRARREQNNLANLAQNSTSNVNLSSEILMAEHNSRGRDRRISSVSYAAVGQVRHDGTRIRAGSHDSDHSGLLGGAAPMGTHNRNGSEATLLSLGGLPQPRYRDRSHSAATSISTTASSFENISPPSGEDRPATARTRASSHLTIGSVSDDGVEEIDLGNERLLAPDTDPEGIQRPPEYDGHDWGEAPEYTEEQRMARSHTTATSHSLNGNVNRAPNSASRTENLSLVTPSIHIQTPTAPNTPIVPQEESERSRSDSTRQA